ncbi:virulence factor family protein, partial [Xanthomonas citri pv. citri]|nr:virulence factor family protein [Xanthomonas citri pv. citri]
GGWVGLDKEVVVVLGEVGVLVVGVDLLCYFWMVCILEGFVCDLECIVSYYS